MAPFRVQEEAHTKFNATRIQEALIITVLTAMLAAGVSTWALSQVLEERIRSVQIEMRAHYAVDTKERHQMAERIEKLFSDLYTPKVTN